MENLENLATMNITLTLLSNGAFQARRRMGQGAM
jgi:hypothetical protein